MITTSRPKNLNLFTIRFPMPAIVSILHRITGIALFLLVPLAIWALSLSLSSEASFNSLQHFLAQRESKLFVWLCLSPLIYHLVAGVRHLLMDIHLGDSLGSGRLGAYLTQLISLVLIASLGVWLW